MNVLTLQQLGIGKTRKPVTNPGATITSVNPVDVSGSSVNSNNEIDAPLANNIKSNGLNKPNINIDFFEFAGIKYTWFI